MYLAENLKYLRKLKGMRQTELADVLGVEQKAISSWECGRRTPTICRIVELAKYHEVTIDDLVLRDLRPARPLCGTNIRYLRLKYGHTQENMSKFLGVSNTTYCKYENGTIEIGIKNLEKLSDFFGVTLDQLVKQNLCEVDV